MRFHLSTCLLLFTVVAVAFGWIVDRSHFDAELAKALQGQRLVDDATFRTQNAPTLPRQQGPDLENSDRLLIVAIAELSESQEYVLTLNEMQGGGETATELARSILAKLHIDSADDYFVALSSFNVPRGKFFDYTDRTTEIHTKLRRFVNQSLPKTDSYTKAARKGMLDQYMQELMRSRTKN